MRKILGTLLALLLLAGAAFAADLEPLMPESRGVVLRPAPIPTPEEEPARDDAPDPAAVLVENLHAIAFDCFKPLPPCDPAVELPVATTCPAGVVNTVWALAPALADSGSDLARAVRAALAGPFTWGELEALLAAAGDAARACGWSLARAYAPEQELTGGALRIEVIPVWLEDVAIEGAGWSNPERLRAPYLQYAGSAMRLADTAGIYAFQSMHPFRRIAPSLSPGEADGSTKLTLEVEERKPWRAFATYETTHSRNSGSGRYTAGFTMATPWLREDILTMQYSKDSRFDHLDSAALVYRHALPWRHFLTVTALWSKSDSEADAFFLQETKDTLVRLAYTVPLPDWKGWVHSFEAGAEWRRSHATSDFIGGGNYLDNVYVSSPLFLSWNGRRWDNWGVTSASIEASFGFSGLAHTGKEEYDVNRARSDRNWFTVRPELRRDWRLPADFQLSQRVWAQWSSDRLVDSAQYYLGGNRSVRGYRESEVSGDKGVGASIELLTPSLTKAMTKNACADESQVAKLPEIRLAGFWDWGVVRRNGRLENYEDRSTTMSGAGVGLRAQWGEYFSARIDYAWRLKDTGRPDDDKKNGYLHATVSVGF